MRTLTLLRLILRGLREAQADRQELATELRTLNATLNQLLLVQSKAANYFPTAPARPDKKKAPGLLTTLGESAILVEAEIAREKLGQQLGREPYDEELWAALNTELSGRAP